MGTIALVMKWCDSSCYEIGTIALCYEIEYDSTCYEMGTIALSMKWVR